MEADLPCHLHYILQFFFSLVKQTNKQTEISSHQELVGFRGSCSIFQVLFKKKKKFAIPPCSHPFSSLPPLTLPHFSSFCCFYIAAFKPLPLKPCHQWYLDHGSGSWGKFFSLLILIKISFANKCSIFPKNWNEEKNNKILTPL